MALKSLHSDVARKWIAIANLLAEEPHAPAPDQAGSGVLDRVLARLRKIPLSNWPAGLLGTHPGTVLMMRTAADAEVDPSAVYELAYSVATTIAKILTAFSDNELAVNEQMYVWLPRPFVRVAVSIDANGRVRTVPTSDFSQFLHDFELVDDVRRFRQCPLCPRFFFAERSDQTACSRSHAKTLSMQKWRQGRGKDYEQQRKIRLWEQEQQADPKQAKHSQHQKRRKPQELNGEANGENAKTRTK
jgi:hypothetical protein